MNGPLLVENFQNLNFNLFQLYAEGDNYGLA